MLVWWWQARTGAVQWKQKEGCGLKQAAGWGGCVGRRTGCCVVVCPRSRYSSLKPSSSSILKKNKLQRTNVGRGMGAEGGNIGWCCALLCHRMLFFFILGKNPVCVGGGCLGCIVHLHLYQNRYTPKACVVRYRRFFLFLVLLLVGDERVQPVRVPGQRGLFFFFFLATAK